MKYIVKLETAGIGLSQKFTGMEFPGWTPGWAEFAHGRILRFQTNGHDHTFVLGVEADSLEEAETYARKNFQHESFILTYQETVGKIRDQFQF